MDIRFDRQRVIVSGAARGFGRHIATSFVSLGAEVYGCDIAADELAVTAKAGVKPAVIDLTKRGDVTAWVRELEKSGPIDVVINNAGGIGGAVRGAIESVSDAEFDKIISINVGAAFGLCRAVAPGMKRNRKGRIVNISSGAGVQSSRAGIHPYTAAKHAVVGLTRQLASEMGPYGVTVNSVAPGFVRTTDETERDWNSLGESGQAALINSIAMRRMGTEEDIGNAVLFLASGKASWITGQVLLVDGGK